MKSELCADLQLNQVIDRNVGDLSGGELQRFAIAVVAVQNAEIYMFDEPSSYLDVKQRLKAAQVVRSLLRPNRFVSDVMKPLLIEQLMDQEVVNLSGGELQRVALCLCLGKGQIHYWHCKCFAIKTWWR
ncbi:ABC transporter E family member 2-like [Castanea sativa]|uniref:ABC transporter E family member 2-like n=1 Tax=Castanea sativa TaxID=21020 RepID=UPI003F64E714